MYEPSKSDWKLFRSKISDWQENYMERLVEKYITYLRSDLPASDKFWEMEKKIRKYKKSPGVLIELRKSTMLLDIAALINDGVIAVDDLEPFSEDLKEAVQFILKR